LLLLLRLLQVTVELKNDLAITGILHSVDQYLNIKLTNTHVQNETKYPHIVRALHPQSITASSEAATNTHYLLPERSSCLA
jgi:U6 snRNA-associated Sm-like protein LSm2